MHVHFSNDGSPPMPAPAERGKLTLPLSLLLLGSGYALVVASPLWSAQLTALGWLHDLPSGPAWLPAAVAGGVALLGAAALIFVVARLVRDVEQRPYASIAPVVAVFAALVLTTTRAQLPGAGSYQPGLWVLLLALLGGSLVGRDGFSARALGWLLAVLPSLALLFALSAVQGESDPVAMLTNVEPSLRTYLLLLCISSVTLALLGVVARRLMRSAALPLGRDALDDVPLRLPRMPQVSAPAYAHAAPQPMQHRQTVSVGGTMLGHPGPADRRAHEHEHAYPRSAPRPSRTAVAMARPSARRAQPVVQSAELAVDDPDLLLLTRRKLPVVRLLAIFAALAFVGWLASYFLITQPRNAAAARARAAASKQSVEAGAASTASAIAAPVNAVEPSSDHAIGGPTVDTLSPALVPMPSTAGAPTTQPIVTPLVRDEAAPPLTSDARAERAQQRAQRRLERAERRRAESARAAESALESPAAKEPAREKPARVAPIGSDDAEPEQKPAKQAKPVAPAPNSEAGRELDLDDLVQNALKGGGRDQAADDPIFGL